MFNVLAQEGIDFDRLVWWLHILPCVIFHKIFQHFVCKIFSLWQSNKYNGVKVEYFPMKCCRMKIPLRGILKLKTSISKGLGSISAELYCKTGLIHLMACEREKIMYREHGLLFFKITASTL